MTEAASQQVFPGVVMGVAVGTGAGRQRLVQANGRLSIQGKEANLGTVYDLASLTKPLATTLSILCLVKEKKISLAHRLVDVFGKAVPADKAEITIANLLGHTSGLPAHRPFFVELAREEKNSRRERLFRMIMDEPLEYQVGKRSVYSDLGFMLLGMVVEAVSGQDIGAFFREKVVGPLGLEQEVFFQQPFCRAGDLERYAVMEECSFRNTTVWGEVSDENAWALGGVAGHAGLFGTINGVLELCVHLLDQWQGREEPPFYRSADLAHLLVRQGIPGSTWALGFDTPSASGSSGGKYLSPASVGHLGFTGTSFWIDPSRDLVMVLLSNRVHPSRENDRIKQFRPRFHNLVIESLGLA